MANKRLIDANALYKKATDAWYDTLCDECYSEIINLIDESPTVDAVPVVQGYNPGDVCIYSFDEKNKSVAIIEIVRILSDERGVAEVRFLKVFVDDTGNGMFDYLLRTGQMMNASFKYLKNITPIGAKMEVQE